MNSGLILSFKFAVCSKCKFSESASFLWIRSGVTASDAVQYEGSTVQRKVGPPLLRLRWDLSTSTVPVHADSSSDIKRLNNNLNKKTFKNMCCVCDATRTNALQPNSDNVTVPGIKAHNWANS